MTSSRNPFAISAFLPTTHPVEASSTLAKEVYIDELTGDIVVLARVTYYGSSSPITTVQKNGVVFHEAQFYSASTTPRLLHDFTHTSPPEDIGRLSQMSVGSSHSDPNGAYHGAGLSNMTDREKTASPQSTHLSLPATQLPITVCRVMPPKNEPSSLSTDSRGESCQMITTARRFPRPMMVRASGTSSNNTTLSPSNTSNICVQGDGAKCTNKQEYTTSYLVAIAHDDRLIEFYISLPYGTPDASTPLMSVFIGSYKCFPNTLRFRHNSYSILYFQWTTNSVENSMGFGPVKCGCDTVKDNTKYSSRLGDQGNLTSFSQQDFVSDPITDIWTSPNRSFFYRSKLLLGGGGIPVPSPPELCSDGAVLRKFLFPSVATQYPSQVSNMFAATGSEVSKACNAHIDYLKAAATRNDSESLSASGSGGNVMNSHPDDNINCKDMASRTHLQCISPVDHRCKSDASSSLPSIINNPHGVSVSSGVLALDTFLVLRDQLMVIYTEISVDLVYIDFKHDRQRSKNGNQGTAGRQSSQSCEEAAIQTYNYFLSNHIFPQQGGSATVTNDHGGDVSSSGTCGMVTLLRRVPTRINFWSTLAHMHIGVVVNREKPNNVKPIAELGGYIWIMPQFNISGLSPVIVPHPTKSSISRSVSFFSGMQVPGERNTIARDTSHQSPTRNSSSNSTLYYPLQVLLIYDELYIAFINYSRGCIVLYRYNHYNSTGKTIDMASAMMTTVPGLDSNSSVSNRTNSSQIGTFHSPSTSIGNHSFAKTAKAVIPQQQPLEQQRWQTRSNNQKGNINSTYPKNAYQCVRYYSSRSAQVSDTYPSTVLQSICDATDLTSDDKDAAVASSIEALMIDHESIYSDTSDADGMSIAPDQPLTPFAANAYKTSYINDVSDISALVSEGQPVPPKSLLYRSIAAADTKMMSVTTAENSERHQKAGVCEQPHTCYSPRLNEDIAETRGFFIASHNQESSSWHGSAKSTGSGNSGVSAPYLHPAVTFSHLTSLVSTAVTSIGKGTVYYNRNYPFFSTASDLESTGSSAGQGSNGGNARWSDPSGNTQQIRDSEGYNSPRVYSPREPTGESQQTPAAFEVAFVLPLPAMSIISAIRAEYYFGYDILVARHWWEGECDKQPTQRLLDSGYPVYPPYLVVLQSTTDNILMAHIPHTLPDEAVALLAPLDMRNCSDISATADVHHQPCNIIASYDIKLSTHEEQVFTANSLSCDVQFSISQQHCDTPHSNSGLPPGDPSLSKLDSSSSTHAEFKYISMAREQQIATTRIMNARKLIGECCAKLSLDSSEMVRKNPETLQNTILPKGYLRVSSSVNSSPESYDQSVTKNCHATKVANVIQSFNAEAASFLASFASYYSLHKVMNLTHLPSTAELALLHRKAEWISAIMMMTLNAISVQRSVESGIVALSGSRSYISSREQSESQCYSQRSSSSLTSPLTVTQMEHKYDTLDSAALGAQATIINLANQQNAAMKVFSDGAYITDLMHEMARMILFSHVDNHNFCDGKDQRNTSKKSSKKDSTNSHTLAEFIARDKPNKHLPACNGRYGFGVYTVEDLQAAENARLRDTLMTSDGKHREQLPGTLISLDNSKIISHDTLRSSMSIRYFRRLATLKSFLGGDSKNDSNREPLSNGISSESTTIHTVPLVHHLPLSVCSSQPLEVGYSVDESLTTGASSLSQSFTLQPSTIVRSNRVTIGGLLPSCLTVAHRVIIPGQTQTSVCIPTSPFSEKDKKSEKDGIKEKESNFLSISEPLSNCRCQQYVVYLNHVNMTRSFSSDHKDLWCYGNGRKDEKGENKMNNASSTIVTSSTYPYYHSSIKNHPRTCLPMGKYDTLLVNTAQYLLNRGAVLKEDLPVCFGAVTGHNQDIVSSVEIIVSFLLCSVTHHEPLSTVSRLLHCAIAHHCANGHHAAWFGYWYDRWKGICPTATSITGSSSLDMGLSQGSDRASVSLCLDVTAPPTHTIVSGAIAASIGEIIRYTNAVKQPHMYPLMSASTALQTSLHKLSSSSTVICDPLCASYDGNTPNYLKRTIHLQLIRPTADGSFLFRKILEAPIAEILAYISTSIQARAEVGSLNHSSVNNVVNNGKYEEYRFRHNYIFYTLLEFCRVLAQRGIPVSAPIQQALMQLLLNGEIVLDDIPISHVSPSNDPVHRRISLTPINTAIDAQGSYHTTNNSKHYAGDYEFNIREGGASPEAYNRLHQLLMYRAFEDHIPTALKLISLHPHYPNAFQVGLDILVSLGAHRHIIRTLLQQRKHLRAAKYYFSIKKEQMNNVLSQQQKLYRKYVMAVERIQGNNEGIGTGAAAIHWMYASNFLREVQLLQVYPSSNDIAIVNSLLQAAADEHDEELKLVSGTYKEHSNITGSVEECSNIVINQNAHDRNKRKKNNEVIDGQQTQDQYVDEIGKKRTKMIVKYLRNRREKKCAKHLTETVKGTGKLFYCIYNLLVCQYLEVAVFRSIKITSAAASLASLGGDNRNINSSFSDYTNMSSSGNISTAQSNTFVLAHFPMLKPYWDRYNDICSK